MLTAKWKWLVVSVLAVVWITASCGLSASSTKPLCTSITSAIRGLLSRTETDQPATKSNTKTDTTSTNTTSFNLPTSPTSFAHYAEEMRIIKSAISTAASMATIINDRTIISASSITPSTTNISGRTMKDFTLTLQLNSKNTGHGGSPPWPNSMCERLLIRPVTHSKKLLAKEPETIIYDATSMARRTGFFPNIYGCRLETLKESTRD